MIKISFSKMFQVSAGLMGALLALKVYALTSSFMVANAGGAAMDLVSDALAGPASGEEKSNATGHPPAASASPLQGTDKPAPSGPVSLCSPASPCAGQVNDPSLDLTKEAATRKADLLADLGRRNQDLEAESKRLSDMKQALEASQEVLDTRLQKYDADQSSLAKHGQEEKRLSDNDIDRLVKIYEAMQPRDAASIFNVLDLQVLVPVIGKMNPRKASAILAGMSPERATTTTQALAGVMPRHAPIHLGTNG